MHRGRRDFDYKEHKPFWQTAFAEGANDFKQTIVNACTGNVAHELTPIPPGHGLLLGALRVDRR